MQSPVKNPEDLTSSRAVLAALRALHEKIRRLERDRSLANEEVETLKEKLSESESSYRKLREKSKAEIETLEVSS